MRVKVADPASGQPVATIKLQRNPTDDFSRRVRRPAYRSRAHQVKRAGGDRAAPRSNRRTMSAERRGTSAPSLGQDVEEVVDPGEQKLHADADQEEPENPGHRIDATPPQKPHH